MEVYLSSRFPQKPLFVTGEEKIKPLPETETEEWVLQVQKSLADFVA